MRAELVEEVDEGGRVLSVVSRADVRRRNLRHRAVYVLVLDSGGRLLAHRRADWKDVWPGRWDVAFGGVAGVGEAPGDTARRELAEEAGVQAPLEPLGGGRYEDGEVRVLGEVFMARSDGPFTFPDGEVVETAWVAPDGLPAWVGGRLLCPDSVAIALPLLSGRVRADLLRRYADAPRRVEDAVRDLSPPALTFRPSPDAWTIAEIVVHLADNELVHGVRLRTAVTESGREVRSYDEALWARELDYASDDLAEALLAFRVLRSRNHRLLARLPEAAWARLVRRPEGGGRTVEQMLRGGVDHVDLHVRQIADRAAEAASAG